MPILATEIWKSSGPARTNDDLSFMNEKRQNAFAPVYSVPHERAFGMWESAFVEPPDNNWREQPFPVAAQ
jgi:hypothetical protein